MQDVFEKIIEKLEEQKAKGIYDSNSIIGEKNAWANAIEIVKQETEQYNNGWIPCSERLPELETEVLIYTEQGGMTIASLTKPDIFWEDEEGNILIGVIAWQPLPEPYNPKGE